MKHTFSTIFIVLGLLYFWVLFEYFWSIDMSLIIPEIMLSYISAFVAFFVLIGVFWFIEKLIESIAEKLVKKTKTDFDDLMLDIFESFISIIKYFGAFYIALQLAKLPEGIDTWISEASSIAVLIILLVFVTKLINLVFTHKLIEESKMKAVSKTLMPFVRRVIIAIVWIIWAITIISNLWYDVTALVAGAWVSGIAVALAAQKSIANIFGAMTILMNKPFKLWDYVTINAHTGTVKDIGLTYITLIDRLGHEVMIPNENIISTSIQNESQREFRRADFSIGLIYDTSLVQMQKGVKIIESILEEYVSEKTLQSYRVNFEAFGDFSLNISVTYFSNTFVYLDFVKEKEEINLEIKKQFTKAKLEMAFPTTEMIIKKGDL